MRVCLRMTGIPLGALLVLMACMVAGCTTGGGGGGNVNENGAGNVNENDNITTNGNGNDNGNDNGTQEADFVGSAACGACHDSVYTSFLRTGHPYKLNAVVDGQPPEFPFAPVVDPPEGLEWTDVSFVIGGFQWKYRVMDSAGYIVLGPTVQFNHASQAFGAYNNDASHTTLDGVPGPWDTNIGRASYDCGKCHTTGYDAEAPAHQGLAGVVGDWEFEGIQCEECHGPGSLHVATRSATDIVASPDTDTVCGKCHTRKPEGIAAKNGFVEHHEQWDEFSRSAHGKSGSFSNGCQTCHNVHESLFDADKFALYQDAYAGNVQALDGLDSPPGIIRECTDCHGGVTVAHAGPDDCKSCHMAFTGKSGVALGGANMGDIRSHAWEINASADALMFTDEAGNPVAKDDPNVKFAALDEDGEPFITLDFACLRCHDDRDLEWAATNAASIHAGD